ncbi:MAG: S8 family serine peptidase [Bryobacter sp.]|nr:S8 family serine peptidase [Bryobacter sp.]
MRNFLPLLLLLASLGWAQFVPNQFIVEYENEALVERSLASSQGKGNFRGMTVKSRFRRVAKAMVVESPEAEEAASEAYLARLRSLPGVKKVHRVRIFKMSLDRAAVRHGLTAAYERVGRENAGRGIRIGIIDSGIELGHPGFADAGYVAPEGFPQASEGHLEYTNNKVIVARSYVDLLSRRDADTTPLDRIGHGTAVAMAAAGVVHEGPNGTIGGMAPGAYLGVYKVFGSPGVNEGATDAALLAAIEDAVKDGMNILNLSLGSSLAQRPEDDIIVQALERAHEAGVVAVVAAGNEGPGFATLASPGTAPRAISVGAVTSDRASKWFLETGAGSTVEFIPGSRTASEGTIEGTLASIAELDPSELACSLLPVGSLAGRIALIQRGNCPFETKLSVAALAGAEAAIVYGSAEQPEALFEMSVGAAGLPAVMVRHGDGVALRTALSEAGGGLAVRLPLAVQEVLLEGVSLANFSGQGPLPGVALKPDLLAVGTEVLTAAQTNTPAGDIYSPSGYAQLAGTSFSAPIVAGTLAALMAERPGQSADAYRSLLVGAASPASELVLAQQGAGVLQLGPALNNPVVLSRPSVSFDENTETLTVRNLTEAGQSLAVAVEARAGVAPYVPQSTVEVGALGEAQLQLELDLAAVPAGTHEGYVLLSTAEGTVARVPYWFGKAETEAAQIQTLVETTFGRSGQALRNLFIFRVLDRNGITLPVTPEVVVAEGNAQIVEVQNRDQDVVGAWGVQVVLAPGNNVLEVRAPGGVTRRVNIRGL